MKKKILLMSLLLSMFSTCPVHADIPVEPISRSLFISDDDSYAPEFESEEIISNEIYSEESDSEDDESEYTYLGKFQLTAYCRCRICNGSFVGQPTQYGTDYVEGRTIAVDPRVIPLGSYVEINIPGEGWHRYRAEDTGSGVKRNHIDIFVEGHENCSQERYNVPCEVRIKKEP